MADRLTATEFKRLMQAGDFEQVEGASVVGEVSFQGERVERDLRLRYVTFLGPVVFSDTFIDGTLDLTGCWFCRTLSLADSEINGSLILDDVVVESNARGTRGGSYDWTVVGAPLRAHGAQINGFFSAASLTVVGSVDLSKMRVDSDIALNGFEIRGMLDISGCRAGGDLSLLAQNRNGEVFAGFVASRIDARNLAVSGNVQLGGIIVNGDLNIWSADIQGNLFVSGMGFVIEGQPRAVATQISGDLHLAASRIRGHVEMSGIDVAGALKLYSGDFGMIRMTHLSGTNFGALQYRPCRFGSVQASNMTVQGDCGFINAEVNGRSADGNPAFLLDHARIEGVLRFWTARLARGAAIAAAEDEPAAEECHTSIVGDLSLAGAVIGGRCDMTNLIVDGSVIADDAEIRGDLVFDSHASLVASLSVRERHRDLYNRVQEQVAEGGKALPRASIRRLSMRRLTCQNDVDLTGLTLRATPQEVERGLGYGSIDAAGATVAGDCWLSRVTLSQDDNGGRELAAQVADAQVAGRADFSGAQIGHLSASVQCFDDARREPRHSRQKAPSSAAPEQTHGLILSGATINELELRPDETRGTAPYPRPMNLADLDVRVWNIGEGQGRQRHRRYTQLLQTDARLRRSTYLAVEQNLRNRGHEAEADKIYRAMMRRIDGDKGGILARPSAWVLLLAGMIVSGLLVVAGYAPFGPLAMLFGLVLGFIAANRLIWAGLLGFGTTPVRIGLVIVVLYIGAVALVYADRRNIGPSIMAEMTAAAPTGPPAEWDYLDAAAIGLRTHVPLASWGLRDQWQLSDADGAALHVAGFASRTLRPEDFGMIMMVLNFLLWPPFLAFALRRAFRHS